MTTSKKLQRDFLWISFIQIISTFVKKKKKSGQNILCLLIEKLTLGLKTILTEVSFSFSLTFPEIIFWLKFDFAAKLLDWKSLLFWYTTKPHDVELPWREKTLSSINKPWSQQQTKFHVIVELHGCLTFLMQ